MKTIYTSKNYLDIWAKYDKVTPLELSFEVNNAIFEIKLLYKKIPGSMEFYEAYSPYGYGGPILVDGDKSIKFPRKKFFEELKKIGIIDVFIRFSPFLNNHKYFPERLLELNRKTVSRELSNTSQQELLKSFNKGTKWAIKKSIKEYVLVNKIKGGEVKDEEIDKFYNLYIRNMEYIGADQYYLFTKECIKDHFSLLGNNVDLLYSVYNDKWIAAAIFLRDQEICHYHLSCSDNNYSKLYPVDRLLFEAIYSYGVEGKKFLHLGGGLSLSEEDSLFKFKLKYGKSINQFFISKVILNKKIYDKLREKNKVENSKYFLINDAIKREGLD